MGLQPPDSVAHVIFNALLKMFEGAGLPAQCHRAERNLCLDQALNECRSGSGKGVDVPEGPYAPYSDLGEGPHRGSGEN